MATTSTTTIINPTDKEGAAVKTYGGLSENAYIEFTPLAFNSFGSFMRLTNKQLSLMIKESIIKRCSMIYAVCTLHILETRILRSQQSSISQRTLWIFRRMRQITRSRTSKILQSPTKIILTSSIRRGLLI